MIWPFRVVHPQVADVAVVSPKLQPTFNTVVAKVTNFCENTIDVKHSFNLELNCFHSHLRLAGLPRVTLATNNLSNGKSINIMRCISPVPFAGFNDGCKTGGHGRRTLVAPSVGNF